MQWEQNILEDKHMFVRGRLHIKKIKYTFIKFLEWARILLGSKGDFPLVSFGFWPAINVISRECNKINLSILSYKRHQY